ncbi:hypothetical protein [Streptomyces sp. CB02009]|uniref:hypothetical protein n=1 Tax=Streptomyces sp. CB02009 TaxID=1703938 RepID=UPI000A600A9A|nr:hypothetical protein [Streptomyces sp. CB02009]
MQPHIKAIVPSLFMAGALTFTVTACGTTAIPSQSTPSATGSNDRNSGTPEGGREEERVRTRLPLPGNATALDAETKGSHALALTFAPRGSAYDALESYQDRLAVAGYEMNSAGWTTRGQQRMAIGLGDEGDLHVSLYYLDAAPLLPPTRQLRDIRSEREDALTLIYDRASNETGSPATAKAYKNALASGGWDVDASTKATATKRGQTIGWDISDAEVLKVTVSTPSSVSGSL